MARIIVFTKDRPLQLHGYLESLLLYSDVKASQIDVLYTHVQGISYDKVIKNFPEIHFIKENEFMTDVLNCLERAEDFVMFGVDDAIFTQPFSLQSAENILSEHQDIFGYSIRLGLDIVPHPDKFVHKDSNWISWNWKETDCSHFNYPWELVSTLYRKSDIMAMLSETSIETIKTPNFLEAIAYPNNSVEAAKDIVSRPLLAANIRSSTIIITINRVQDEFPNSVDNLLATDIYTLNKLYNTNNDTLNIQAISKMKHHQPHVDAAFFILRKSKKGRIKLFLRKVKRRLTSVLRKI